MPGKLLSNKRIFVVEDDMTNMAVLAVLLHQHGAMVIQDYWNGDTISLIKQRFPIDIVLLDLMLRNGVSGYDIFAKIRAEPELNHIPVVAVSASDPSIEIPKAQALGFTGFIHKPINLHRFPHQILGCMQHQLLWDSD